jgi:hypothetical protein
MLKITLTLTFISLFFLNSAFAQEFSISGTLYNEDDNATLVGATLKLVSKRDTTIEKYTNSGLKGEFRFEKLARGRYKLEITYIGFEKYVREVIANGENPNIGIIKLKPATTNLQVVEIKGTAVRAEQKGDTTLYNAAAFKVTEDATTEDLVKKMPGITIENGIVKAHGEDVKKILVDGKQFFGDDPSVTLKNLPAEVVDKIQVFDKMSDQAAWSGFDDGSGQKTINIVTRSAKNSGQFGKFSAGYGTDDHYLLGANVNFFKGQRRITLLAMSNNVNQQNFSADDILGSSSGSSSQGMSGGGRSGGNAMSSQMGPQNGIFSTHAIGANYTNSFGTKMVLNASYFYNNGETTTNKTVDRQYIGSSNNYYNDSSQVIANNINHRLNMRIEYNPDSSNSFVLTPRLSIQDNESNSLLKTQTSKYPEYLPTDPKTLTQNDGDANGYNFNNEFLYRYKFRKKGRTASITLGTGINNRYKDNYQLSASSLSTDSTGKEPLNQYGKTVSNGYNLSSNIVYTEPIGTKSQLQFNYQLSYSENDNDKKTYNYSTDQQAYILFDTLLSNIYNNGYLTHRVGGGYLYQTEKANLNLGLTYEYAELNGQSSFPVIDSTKKSYSTALPNMMFNYKFTQFTNLRMSYRVSTNAPSTTQLQKVLDISNPLLLSMGNPNLNQEIRHFAMGRFSHSNKEKTSNVFGMLFFQKTIDYIANSSFTIYNDTLINGYQIAEGSHITLPKNLDGAWKGRALVTIGFPLKPIKCNLNLNTGFSFNRLPGLIENQSNFSNTYGINLGSVLSSNISQKIDFTLTYNVNFNLVENSIQPQLNNNYLFQIASIQFNWEFWKGFFVQNSVTYQNYNGLSSNVSDQYTLWNFNLGKRIFKNKAGEIKLSCYDILDENTNLNRTVTDSYIEDSNTESLRQYFMLSLTYNLRKFSGKIPTTEERRGGFDGRPGEHFH